MPQAKDHIVKSFDEEIRKLNNLITYMGGLAESQLQAAVEALLKRDADAASRIIHDDAKIDEQETLISQQVVRLLALRQPMAIDLRQIVAALKISSDLERFADYATNVAKRSIALSQLPPLKPLFAIPRMAKLVQQNMKDVLDAYTEADADKAMNVWKRDEEVDEIYTSLFRELLDLHDGGPAQHFAVDPPAVHRQEHRAHGRSRHQYRGNHPLHRPWPRHRGGAAEGRQHEFLRLQGQ